MNDFKGKTVIVTGGASGIGLSIAESFARKEANVVIADIDEMNGKQLEDRLNKTGLNSLFIKTDVKNETDIKELITKSFETFGSIDILINNAGISKFHSFFELSVEMWDEVINTNLRSVFLCGREAPN